MQVGSAGRSLPCGAGPGPQAALEEVVGQASCVPRAVGQGWWSVLPASWVGQGIGSTCCQVHGRKFGAGAGVTPEQPWEAGSGEPRSWQGPAVLAACGTGWTLSLAPSVPMPTPASLARNASIRRPASAASPAPVATRGTSSQVWVLTTPKPASR